MTASLTQIDERSLDGDLLVSADLSALWTPTVGHDERVTEDPGGPGTPSNPYRGSGGAVRACLDPGGGMSLKAMTPEGDPVELSASEARSLARILLDLADQDEGSVTGL